MLWRTQETGKCVWILGNSGTVSTASHVSHDLTRASVVEGKAMLRIASLTDQLAALMVWAEDAEFSVLLAQQVRNLISEGDLVITMSANGGSSVVIETLKIANDIGAQTVGLTGIGESDVSRLVDTTVVIPSDDYSIIEDRQLAIGHALADSIRNTVQLQADTVSPVYLASRRAQGKRSPWTTPLVG